MTFPTTSASRSRRRPAPPPRSPKPTPPPQRATPAPLTPPRPPPPPPPRRRRDEREDGLARGVHLGLQLDARIHGGNDTSPRTAKKLRLCPARVARVAHWTPDGPGSGPRRPDGHP